VSDKSISTTSGDWSVTKSRLRRLRGESTDGDGDDDWRSAEEVRERVERGGRGESLLRVATEGDETVREEGSGEEEKEEEEEEEK
jgi:hypothetical protein